ncbi:MAG: radical SAM family heme chaperone HemW [Bacteroidetes bacterium]|nr:MAG: radical SAM family heme chaperone HemW [Bacteroidota bacterium]
MSGIYIHIPFCRRKCHYCNFFSLASLKYKERFLAALKEEIFLRKKYLNGKSIESIYFGGGTPSILQIPEIEGILEDLRKYFILAENREITLEANPDDLDPGILRKYLAIGINRLSIGVQSFFDDDLEYLNRIHSGQRAEEAVQQAKEAGFSNISLDFIYGIPTLTAEKWQKNLEKAFSLEVPHISAYSLTVEPKTALDLLIRKKKLPGPEEEQILEHFRILLRMMKEQEFEHYEISNFCKNEFYSQHNSMYWNGTTYLGLGPSAHSYNGTSRQWNISNLVQYINQINRNEPFFESEELTPLQKYNEYVMVSLRTMWGCDARKIRNVYGDETVAWFTLHVARYLQSGNVFEKEGIYYLTDEGKLFADGIAADLFLEPQKSPEW